MNIYFVKRSFNNLVKNDKVEVNLRISSTDLPIKITINVKLCPPPSRPFNFDWKHFPTLWIVLEIYAEIDLNGTVHRDSSSGIFMRLSISVK